MAPVIWGLDLAEIRWSKFKSSYMWNSDYHLRRTKFIIYQLALIFCVVSESLGTAALSDYIDEERYVQTRHREVYVFNNDYVGAASYNVFAGVFVAFIFGAAFFFDLIWPERKENHAIRIAWKACGVVAVCFELASALTLTIITATHSGYIVGVDHAVGDVWLHEFKDDGGTPPLEYKHNGRALAAVVFVWLGFVATAVSCILLFRSIENTERGPGPRSTHARKHDEASEYEGDSLSVERDSEKSIKQAEAAQSRDQVDGAASDAPAAPAAETSPPVHEAADAGAAAVEEQQAHVQHLGG